MNIIAKAAHLTLSHSPSSIKNILRSILPLPIKRALGKTVMKEAVIIGSTVTVFDGRKFKAIEDRLFLRVFYDKNYEPLLTAVAKNLIYPDDIVIDIGANFGWYTTLFCQLSIPGKVICYEPAPHSYKILEENIRLNNMADNISVRKTGVGENIGTFLMQPGSSSESGLAHIVTEKDNNTIEIPIVTLDEDLADLAGKISYIKIDIEGFEYSALKGGKTFLDVEDQPIIQIELNDEALVRAGSSREETVSFLKNIGYDFFEADPGKPGHLRVSDTSICSDVFCFGKGKYTERLKNILVS